MFQYLEMRKCYAFYYHGVAESPWLWLSAKILRILSPSLPPSIQQNISIVEARRRSATTPREAGSSFETC